jgi:Phosphatidylethanolamine-binding protein
MRVRLCDERRRVPGRDVTETPGGHVPASRRHRGAQGCLAPADPPCRHRPPQVPIAQPRSSSAASARLAAVPPGAVEGVNDFGRRGYRDPCPPHGAAHHYHFVVLALDTRLGLAAGARRPDIWTPASVVTCWAGANWSPPTGAPERVRASASEPGPASRSEVPILLRHRSQSAANKPAARAREPPIWSATRSRRSSPGVAPNQVICVPLRA